MAKGYACRWSSAPDTHVANQIDYMAYGVSVALRGWVEKKDVLNTLSCEQLIKWFSRKEAAGSENGISN